MDPQRQARYLAKIAHARRRLSQAESWLDDAAKSEQALLATYKAFQEAAEAAADLVAMALVDSGVPAQDDHRNFARAAELDIISRPYPPLLSEATGLRNRFVHEYDGIETARARGSIQRLAPVLRAFLEEVERWLSKTT